MERILTTGPRRERWPNELEFQYKDGSATGQNKSSKNKLRLNPE
jgi:hypothetical protein